MRTYEEMINQIMDEVKKDERIRAVTMEGSNSCAMDVHDKYSDFDLTFFVSDIREFTADKKYMERFGEILIMQCPDDEYCAPYDYTSRENFAYLTQYKDGQRIDLTLIDVSNIAKQADFISTRKVLINKDNFKELVDITHSTEHLIKKPSEFEYFNTCNEFRWISNYVTKGLCREEFYYAKRMMEECMMNMFIKMINFKIGIDNDFKVTTGKCAKYLKNYLSEEEMRRFQMMFAGGEYHEMWFKLFFMYDYFAELAKYVADKLGFTFDEKESNEVRAFMQKRRDDLKAEKAFEKNVLLLGDSLRMGYEPVVRKRLKGKAGVFGPAENGRWAGYTLNSLRFWTDSFPTPDIIHWNNGLWDLGDDYQLGRPFSLPEEYESALERMITVLNKLFPNAKIIMATTLPTDNPDSSDIEGYNEIMKKVAKKHNIPVNDMFPIVKGNPALIGPDHIHLTTAGFEKIGSIVAAEIEKHL